MKILSARQMGEVDAYTIENEPIPSIELMERAASALTRKVTERWPSTTPVKIFAGPGNNGGDALAVARMLLHAGYKVETYLFNTSGSMSADCKTNRARLKECEGNNLTEVTTSFTPPPLTADDLVIDGLFGTGISRPVNGGFASVVKYINASKATVVSIDVPSGLMCEDNTYNVMNHIVKAHYTYTFHAPKLAFMFADNAQYVGEWEVLDIKSIDPDDERTATHYSVLEPSEIRSMLKTRPKFAHKGTAGHASLIAGKKGMAGAAILAARACMRSGAGKLTIHTQEANRGILQVAIPEAVLDIEEGNEFTKSFDANEFDAMAIGPGIGTDKDTAQAFIEQLKMTHSPIVIDADGLNILGSHRGWILQIPRNTILTPHKKELFGLISTSRNGFDELKKTVDLCVRQSIYIVIKGAYSAIVSPDGKVAFNPTGNPGMATAGSGDVLTGIILGLLAQGYSTEHALKTGVYLHGLAGDIAAEEKGTEGLMASDIIESLPKAWKSIRNS